MAVIGKIRERSSLLAFFIALAILAFLLMDASGAGGGGVAPKVGTVNGLPLDAQEYSQRLDRAYSNARTANPNMDEASRIGLKKNVWDGYVKDVLADAEYDKLGLKVGQSEMRDLLFGSNPPASITGAPIFQDESGQYSPQKLKDYMAQMMEGEDQNQRRYFEDVFLQSLKRNRQNEKYGAAIGQAMYVPAFMAKQRNAINSVSADIEYVKVPYTQIPDGDISFTDSDLRAYINANKAAFERDASRSVDFVTFDVEASNEDIQATKKYVDDLLVDFRTTTDAAAYIAANSDDKFNASYLSRANLAGNAKVDAFFTQPVGTVFPTYLENNTYKAVKIIDRKYSSDTVAATPENEVVQIAVLSRKIEASSATVNQISREANEFASRNSSASAFKAGAEQLAKTIGSATDFTAASTAIGTMGASEDILNWAFAANLGDVSPVFDLNGEKFAVAVLTNTKEAGMPSVDDVRTRVEAAVKKEKKAEKIASQIQGSDLNAVASKFGVSTATESGLRFSSVSAGSIGREPAVIAAATGLAQGATSSPITGEQGVYVVKVTNRSGDAELSDYSAIQKSERSRMKAGVQFQATNALMEAAELTDNRSNVLRRQ